ncbi:NPCBM/NEW2 domain-containing protein [Kitasatospora sp. NPDC088346]|uniref:NPCBM/NEW2 domain-containing protein n=1 Tax=Kitasatospora sp. NPDC088346 TaxID=3364073 RepID=UPI003805859A
MTGAAACAGLAPGSRPPAAGARWRRSKSNGEDRVGDGRALMIRGTICAKGIGTHAGSTVSYALGGTCTKLTVGAGIDDEMQGRGAVEFQIYRGTTLVASSGPFTGKSPTAHLTADLTGGTNLRLVAKPVGNGINYDHADRADPRRADRHSRAGPAQRQAPQHSPDDGHPGARQAERPGPRPRRRRGAQPRVRGGRTPPGCERARQRAAGHHRPVGDNTLLRGRPRVHGPASQRPVLEGPGPRREADPPRWRPSARSGTAAPPPRPSTAGSAATPPRSSTG